MCWCWQFSWFSQRWKIIACGVAAGIVCVFVASTPTPIPRQSFGSGAHFKACVKLYVMLIKMEGSRVNWQSPTTASAKWHTEKCLATNGRAEFYLSSMQACRRRGDVGHLYVHSLRSIQDSLATPLFLRHFNRKEPVHFPSPWNNNNSKTHMEIIVCITLSFGVPFPLNIY